MPNKTPSVERSHEQPFVALNDALEVLIWFGCAIMNAGDTAFRAREWMEKLAGKMGFDELSASFALNSIVVSVRRGSQRATIVREVRPPQINAQQIGELEGLVETLDGNQTPYEIAHKLSQIEGQAAHLPCRCDRLGHWRFLWRVCIS